MAAFLPSSSSTGYIDFNFSARNDAKGSDNASTMMKYKRTLYQASIKKSMKINLVLRDDALNVLNLQLNHLLHVVTLKDTNSLIQIS